MNEQQREVRVSGQGIVSAPPDLGQIRLGVRVTNRATEQALETANERIEGVRQALIDAGVANDDISLGRFSITTVYDHVDGRQSFRGYQVNHDLSITVRDIDRTGALLSVAVGAGADDVRSVTFSVEDPGSWIDRARERAVDDARHKAEQLVQFAGAALGHVLSMHEQSSAPVPVERHEMRAMASSFTAKQISDVPILPADTEFSVHVDIVWQLTE